MAFRDWSAAGHDRIVANCVALRRDDLARRPCRKTKHRRALRAGLPGLTDRSAGSVEFKHQNLSAVPKRLGEAWITGYKPAFNFQADLVDAVMRGLRQHREGVDRAPLPRRARRMAEAAGAGAGYDIASSIAAGRERLIDVKTTTGWERTPFHISRNELALADARRADWCRFRPRNLARDPRALVLDPRWRRRLR